MPAEITLLHLVLYSILNIFAFFTFTDDKAKSAKSQWRTSEKRLLIYAMIGPFGAATAMHLFRHKTQKVRFRLVYIFLLIHSLLIGYYFLLRVQG